MLSTRCLQQIIFLVVIKHYLSRYEFSQIKSESSNYKDLSQLETHIHHVLVQSSNFVGINPFFVISKPVSDDNFMFIL